jgi:hypothetical protein
LLGLVHLAAYAAHPAMLILLLTLLPLLLAEGGIHLPLAYLSIASFGPPLMHVIGQKTLHRDWAGRLLRFPILMLIGTGMAWKNTLAVARGILRRPTAFNRTPKFQSSQNARGWEWNRYALGLDASNVGELVLTLYAGVSIAVAISQGNWYIVPFLSLYLFGFGYVGLFDVWQQLRKSGARPQSAQPGRQPGVRRVTEPGSIAHMR